MYMYSRLSLIFVVAALAIAMLPARAAAQRVEVKEPWIRGTVAGQKATGAYMEIQSKVPARLVAAASPAAGTVEIHNMKMEGGVMKMFAVDGVDVPAGKAVRLAPGGFHVMLLDLREPLKPGDRVSLRLTFELADRTREVVDLNAEVRDVAGKPRHPH